MSRFCRACLTSGSRRFRPPAHEEGGWLGKAENRMTKSAAFQFWANFPVDRGKSEFWARISLWNCLEAGLPKAPLPFLPGEAVPNDRL
jgi:hypothetical protein